MCWIFHYWCHLSQDEVSYAKALEFYPLVVITCHLLLILGYSLGSFVSHFVQIVQVQFQLVVITVFVKKIPSQAGDPYLGGDYGFHVVNEVERHFSY